MERTDLALIDVWLVGPFSSLPPVNDHSTTTNTHTNNYTNSLTFTSEPSVCGTHQNMWECVKYLCMCLQLYNNCFRKLNLGGVQLNHLNCKTSLIQTEPSYLVWFCGSLARLWFQKNKTVNFCSITGYQLKKMWLEPNWTVNTYVCVMYFDFSKLIFFLLS